MNKTTTSKQKLKTHERQVKALELRKLGWGYRDIAGEIGVNVSSAYQLVRKALDETLREPADELRVLELERLDHLTTPFYQKALCGDEKACDRVLKLMERRAKLLGLDREQLQQVVDLRQALDATREKVAEYEDPDEEADGGDVDADAV